MDPRQTRRFVLITYPRTASNLLIHILALDDQPHIEPANEHGGYFFRPPSKVLLKLDLYGKRTEEWMEEERTKVRQSYQDCFRAIQEYLDVAESTGKSAFVKEHVYHLASPTALSRLLHGPNGGDEAQWRVQIPRSYGPESTQSRLNLTVLPDEFLKTWLPTFLIRHPALAFPSRYRVFLDLKAAGEDNDARLKLTTDMSCTRALYDWYCHNRDTFDSHIDGVDTWPLILDADDIMTEPGVLVRFCEITGMDHAKLRFSWATTSEEQQAEWGPLISRMLSTLSASTGILPEKSSSNLDIDQEAKKWRAEFGELGGEKVETFVRAAMPDYEFMKARRLRPKGV